MDKIIKTINIDNSRSHSNGLLPFVYFNGDKPDKINEVDETLINGNYGQFVCDFGCLTVKETGIEVLSRLKYLDVLSRYYFIQEQLSNAVFVKKYLFNEKKITKINCENSEIDIDINTVVKFKPVEDELDIMSRYEFHPIDIDFFKEDNGCYNPIFYKPEDLEHEYYVLIPNYDTVINYNEKWNEWWIYNFENGWEELIFDNYKKNDKILEEFKFCYEVERYLLGKIEVIRNGITGDRVPDYVYKTNIAEDMKWFEVNSAVTMSAYTSKSRENASIINEWESKGGGDFYNFLSEINDEQSENYCAWQTQKEVHAGLWGYFTYIPPEVNLEVILNHTYEYETILTPYEYSISGDVKVNVVKPYTPIENLAPKILDGTIEVESCLDTLIHPSAVRVTDEIFGIYKNFNDDDQLVGQMFKCTLTSGTTNDIVISNTYSYAYVQDVTVLDDENGIYRWWNCEPIDFNENLTCGDGENISPNDDTKYRNITLLSLLTNFIGKSEYGEYFHFLVKYDNGVRKVEGSTLLNSDNDIIRSLSIPYMLNYPLNVNSYDNGDVVYDTVTAINEFGTRITIKYAIGVTQGKETTTGIHYQDSYKYSKGIKANVIIDDMYETVIYYDKIDIEENKKTIYNNEIKEYRDFIPTTIRKMEVGSIWNENDAVETILFFRDDLTGLKENPRYSVDLTYDRGNASAWEKHFKLSECNTMEDLVNYGNNFFNI